MEREHIDEGPVPAHAPSAPSREEVHPPAHLPSAVGNAAFARVVQSSLGGSGAGVARASAKSQGAGPLDEGIAADIQQARGGGAPLDDAVRAEMEGGFGVDLSGVRVHTDARADALNRSVQAEAFTTGTDIFFRSGTYSPGASDGRRLLAHELTHVVQQSTGQVEGGRVSHPDDAHEVEARAVADTMATTSASPATSATSAPVSVDRDVDEGELDEEVRDGAVSRQELEEEDEEVPETP